MSTPKHWKSGINTLVSPGLNDEVGKKLDCVSTITDEQHKHSSSSFFDERTVCCLPSIVIKMTIQTSIKILMVDAKQYMYSSIAKPSTKMSAVTSDYFHSLHTSRKYHDQAWIHYHSTPLENIMTRPGSIIKFSGTWLLSHASTKTACFPKIKIYRFL